MEPAMLFSRQNKLILMISLVVCIFVSVIAIAQIAWVKDFDTALKQAAREKKFVVLDISASW
jgi:hypothetical protein